MLNVQIEMPRYQCHKKVWALKIESMRPNTEEDDGGFTLHFEGDRYSPILMSHSWCKKHNPQEGGYYVVYEDGYKSFSPAQAFESGYSRI